MSLEALALSGELRYVEILFALFVVPRILQRFRIPSAVTSLALGAAAGMGFGWFIHDDTIQLLSTFGIVALFLFAGLELSTEDLRRGKWIIAQHLAIRAASLVAVAVAAHAVLGLGWRPAALVALVLMTPSAGFILDSLHSMGFGEKEEYWIKSKAVSSELLALATMFVAIQADSPARLAVSGLVLVAMIVLLPAVFRWFARWIVPHAPRSEFAFLLMVAVGCAIVTRELGVYYLVGAFVVGVAAKRFRQQLPAMASDEMLRAVELFASFFVPFYFFHAGLGLSADDFGLPSLVTGLGFLVVFLPVRTFLVAAHRRFAMREPVRSGMRVSIALLPTLVFTLVIAQILDERFAVPTPVFGGLVVYTLVNTLIPAFALHLPPPDYEHPHVPELGRPASPERA